MTYEEMRAVVDGLLEEGSAAGLKADEVLDRVPRDDAIVGELYSLFSAAADEFEEVSDNVREFDEIIAAATKVRDTSLAWARYVEAVAAAPEQSIPGRIDAILAQLQKQGLIVDP
jgi:hypothetical protein